MFGTIILAPVVLMQCWACHDMMIITTTTISILRKIYMCKFFTLTEAFLFYHEEPPPYNLLQYIPFALSLTFCYCCWMLWIIQLNYVGYIGEFEIIDDHRSNKIVVELIGRLNKCGVISPRFDVTVDEIEKWVVNLLPSRQFGHILLSTTYGIMTHEEARRKKTGGKILGFFY